MINSSKTICMYEYVTEKQRSREAQKLEEAPYIYSDIVSIWSMINVYRGKNTEIMPKQRASHT